jgi:hypothetical protein
MAMRRTQITAIESRIIVIRGHKVLLSTDLAHLYGVSVKVLNQAVRRNLARFPEDFMFQLGWEDIRPLRSQIVTLKTARARGAHSKYRPFAFTEQGIAMLSSIEARYDRQFKVVFDAIRQLMQPVDRAPRRRIGFL